MNHTRHRWAAAGSFDDRAHTARVALDVLERCVEQLDQQPVIAAAEHVWRSLEIVERSAIAIGVGQPSFHDEVAAVLRVLQHEAYPVLARAPTPQGVVATHRFLVRLEVAA